MPWEVFTCNRQCHETIDQCASFVRALPLFEMRVAAKPPCVLVHFARTRGHGANCTNGFERTRYAITPRVLAYVLTLGLGARAIQPIVYGQELGVYSGVLTLRLEDMARTG